MNYEEYKKDLFETMGEQPEDVVRYIWNRLENEYNRGYDDGNKDNSGQIEPLVIPKIAEAMRDVKKASQTGILITRNITELGSVHLRASMDKKFIDLDVLQDILDSNFSE